MKMSATGAAESEAELLPPLPNHLALNCLARLPRRYHPLLSQLSHPFRYLLSSPDFFTARSLLHCTEPLLFLIIRPPQPSLSHLWFTLLPISTTHVLLPLPPPPSFSLGSAYVALGPKIYVLGGSIDDVPSPRVWVLDCRSNKWESGPSMRVGREFSAAGVVDGKIYVMGGCVAETWARSKNWAEVFDPAKGRWESVPSRIEVAEKWMHASAVVEDKIYAMADRGGVVFDPRSGGWGRVGKRLDLGWRGRGCGVNEILFCYEYLGKIRGFDVEEGVWKELKGVEKGLPRFLCGATMANMGGDLMVVWEAKARSGGGGGGKEMEIWCANVEVRKDDQNGELRGKIGWCSPVLKVPNGSTIVHCLSVEL